MQSPRWRLVVGPLITVATGIAIMIVQRHVLHLPNPGALQVLTVLVSAYIGGTIPGLLSAAIAIGFGFVFVRPDHLLAFQYDAVIRFVTIVVLAPAVALIVGIVRGRERRNRERVEAANRELGRLHAALNHIGQGLVLLDDKFRTEFTNAAFRKIWNLPDAFADSRPGLDEVTRHLMSAVSFAVPPAQHEAFIAARMAEVRAGKSAPTDVRLAAGGIIRTRTYALPQGGRVLIHVDVTDIVRRTDELERLRAALEYVDEGVVLLDPELRARFMNAASRRIGGLRERAPDEWPHYSELIEEVAGNLAYAVPEGELAAFVAARKEFVASGDPTPVEMRMAGGGVFRFRCAALPDGGRMLLYSDITDLVRQAEQLETLATTDGLSGLYNRRHFLRLAEAEWSRYARHGRPLALIALDIDGFKAINDRFGHDAGDRVIAHVAGLCREDRRPSDVVARVGGEEFAVLLPETELAAAAAVAERLRARFAGNAFVTDAFNLSLSASLGVAAAGPGVDSVAALMKEADRALYEAKRSGRNRVVTADAARPVAAPEATRQPTQPRSAKRVSG
jgi:diguanylate cyclase (GGDEF)-like protein